MGKMMIITFVCLSAMLMFTEVYERVLSLVIYFSFCLIIRSLSAIVFIFLNEEGERDKCGARTGPCVLLCQL